MDKEFSNTINLRGKIGENFASKKEAIVYGNENYPFFFLLEKPDIKDINTFRYFIVILDPTEDE